MIRILRKLSRQLTIHYSFVQAIYWCSHVSIMNFMTLFLQSRGCTNAEIGIIITIASLLSIPIQSWIGNLSDRNTKITPHKLVLALAAAAMTVVAFIWLAPVDRLVICICYVLLLCIIYTIQPFITAMGFTYINHGLDVNFGLARGLGSITCAGMSAMLGTVIAMTQPEITFPVFLTGFILLCILTITFVPKVRHHGSGTRMTLIAPHAAEKQQEKRKQAKQAQSSKSVLAFFRQYKTFCFFLIGVAILKANHQTLHTYMINIVERVGGNSAHLGRAVALAAAVELPTMALSGLLLKKFSSTFLLKASAFFFIIKTTLTYFATTIGMVYFAQSFQMLSFALFIPVATQYCNQVMADDDKVMGQAMLNVAMISIANIIGNLFGGTIIDYFGLNTALIFDIGCTVVGFVIFCLTAKSPKRK